MPDTPTSREIINAIVRDKQCPHRMGMFEHFWGDTQPAWEKQGLPEGVNLQEYFDHDIRFIPGAKVRNETFPGQKIIVEETDETVVTINGWGAKLRHWKHKDGTPEHIDFDLTGEKIWREKYREPLLDLDLRRLGEHRKIEIGIRTIECNRQVHGRSRPVHRRDNARINGRCHHAGIDVPESRLDT